MQETLHNVLHVFTTMVDAARDITMHFENNEKNIGHIVALCKITSDASERSENQQAIA